MVRVQHVAARYTNHLNLHLLSWCHLSGSKGIVEGPPLLLLVVGMAEGPPLLLLLAGMEEGPPLLLLLAGTVEGSPLLLLLVGMIGLLLLLLLVGMVEGPPCMLLLVVMVQGSLLLLLSCTDTSRIASSSLLEVLNAISRTCTNRVNSDRDCKKSRNESSPFSKCE